LYQGHRAGRYPSGHCPEAPMAIGNWDTRVVDFELPPEDHPTRAEVRGWLGDHPSPSGRMLAEAGLVAPHWPKPWGRAASAIDQLIVDEELRAAGVRRPENPIGIGWAGPTILAGGTEDQQRRWLPAMLDGSEIWCQLFSEPGAGSDLASLTTRATRDGDGWVVSGQKVWTSLAHVSKWGILLARTDDSADRHEGISYLICPMDAPGVEVRPIVEMTGIHLFNEVFLDEVFIPRENLIGEEGRGWSLAKVTLANERVSLSSGGSLWGRGPTAEDLLDIVRQSGGCSDPEPRQALAQLYIESEILRLIRLRTLSAQIAGRPPGPEASVRKLLADEHGQHVMGIAKDLAGAAGMLSDSGPMGAPVDLWNYGFLFAPALTIGGGTTQVQKNILAERVLGLPGEPKGG
jgi:alkylation response protein AidB-like acyl-CoA dehydrogenase